MHRLTQGIGVVAPEYDADLEPRCTVSPSDGTRSRQRLSFTAWQCVSRHLLNPLDTVGAVSGKSAVSRDFN
jgi:hypothetical protein